MIFVIFPSILCPLNHFHPGGTHLRTYSLILDITITLLVTCLSVCLAVKEKKILRNNAGESSMTPSAVQSFLRGATVPENKKIPVKKQHVFFQLQGTLFFLLHSIY